MSAVLKFMALFVFLNIYQNTSTLIQIRIELEMCPKDTDAPAWKT